MIDYEHELWDEFELQYIEFKQAHHEYLRQRSKYAAALRKMKKQSPHSMTWKQYEGKSRRMVKKLSLPTKKGYQWDHKRSILYCYCMGISLEECNHPDNLELIPRKENMAKGPLVFRDFTEAPSSY